MILRFANYYTTIQRWLSRLEELAAPSQGTLPFETIREFVRDVSADMENEAKQLGLVRTFDRIQRINKYLHGLPDTASITDNRMSTEIRILREALEDDLNKRTVFFPSIMQAKYFGAKDLFGEKVSTAFPSAKIDIFEAGNCYATDNFTACVFHLMRVAEMGMRALARDLKVNKIGKKPVEYVEWGIVCKHLSSKVNALQQKQRGPKKAEILKRYADAASQADYINEIWRKDISHARARKPYNEPEALSVMTRVKEFMQSLAGWLSEPVRKP